MIVIETGPLPSYHKLDFCRFTFISLSIIITSEGEIQKFTFEFRPNAVII